MTRRDMATHGYMSTLVGALLFGTSLPVSAQTTHVVSSEARCPNCRIELVPLVTLGDSLPEAPGVLSGFVRTVRIDRRGRYFLSYADPGRLIMWFDQDGRFQGTVGREGAGPGEYKWPAFLEIDAHDSLYIYDHGNARVTVLDPSLQLARSYNLSGTNTRAPTGLLRLADGRLVLNAISATRARVGFPLHFIGADGVFLDPFGGGDEVYRLDQLVSTYRRLARGRDSTFWAGRATAYLVEQYDPTGKLLTVIERDVNWFQPWNQTLPPTPDRRAQPQIAGVAEMDGLLWVTVLAPDPAWRDALYSQPDSRGRGTIYMWDDWHQIFDTVVEVIDPRRGELVASTRLSQYLPFMTHQGLVAGSRDNDDGYRFVDIWRMQLINP